MDSDQAADTTKETVNDKVTTSDVNNNRLSLSSAKTDPTDEDYNEDEEDEEEEEDEADDDDGDEEDDDDEDNDDDDNDDEDDDEDDEDEEDDEAEDELFNMLGNKSVRQEPEGSSSSSSSQPSKKVKVNEDDEESDDEDDVGENAVFVAEDLSGVIEASNIIPRTKRRSALASGLVRANNGHTGSSSSAKRTIDSDDEEGDF